AGWATNLNWCTNAPLPEWHGVEVNKTGRVESSRSHLQLSASWRHFGSSTTSSRVTYSY
ncbi:unnamed protein product, partial [Ectocarpus sp. 8 AP-2014]